MAQVQQRVLAGVLLAGALVAGASGQRRFYDDDPLWKMPAPLPVEKVKARKLDDLYDYFFNTFGKPGQPKNQAPPPPALGVNTLGEAPDGDWYVNRHYWHPMSVDEAMRGPDRKGGPSENGEWTITGAKTEGVTPGFDIKDSRGVKFKLKFDPQSNPEMATAADVIGAKLFYALGYHVPENYLVTFPRGRLKLRPNTTFTDVLGRKRPMRDQDVDDVLLNVPFDRQGRYRGVASRFLDGVPLGERRWHGTRADDPNDIYPHEHRRDLRGMFVFCAWLGHEDSRAINSLDMLVEEDGIKRIRHYLIDFGSILGSASTKSNSARSGHEYLFAWKPAAAELLTLGLWVPDWAKVKYPNLPSVGRYESAIFDPERFRPEYLNPAFVNRRPDDNFWAAKQVMALSPEHIRAMVKTGGYSDPKASEWVTAVLLARREKIGRTYFKQVLPLDRFEVRDGVLRFEDLAVLHKMEQPRDYRVAWFRFDNQRGQRTAIEGASGAALPEAVRNGGAGEYFAAEVRGDDSAKAVVVYLRKRSGDVAVVGVDRRW